MSEWPQHRVENWLHLQTVLDGLGPSYAFRGQASAEWGLVSSFRRLLGDVDESHALGLELQAILQFRSRAHLHLKPSVLPPNPFSLETLDTYLEWLMLMQHHGAPTRLLDWTPSPYVALYFACIERWQSDAAVWFFDHIHASEAGTRALGANTEALLDFVDYPATQIQATEGEVILFTATKKMLTRREVAQRGAFTFTNRIQAEQQTAIARASGAGGFGSLVIPKELKPEVVQRLDQMNVTAAALFPGTDGIGQSIRDYLRLAELGYRPVTGEV